MSEEEKKAIETLKEVASDEFDTLGDDISPKMAQNILNVLENQQKEIEVLTLDLEEMTKSNNHKLENWVHKNILNSYISKVKIREKIEKYREKLEKLHSQELWNEPEDSIKDFKYNHYLEAYKKLLEEK